MFWVIMLLLRRLPQGEVFFNKKVVRRGGVYVRVGIVLRFTDVLPYFFFIRVRMDNGTSMKERSTCTCNRSLLPWRFVQS